MPLPSIGGGYQIGDGNGAEANLYAQAAPQTATATATLTAAQLFTNLLVANPSTTAAAYTLPTVANLEAVAVNAHNDSAFELIVVNLGTASGAVTMTTSTGWTLVGNMVIAVTTSARFLARKTGDLAWTLYRTA
jgi:hypothetical protein